MDELKQILVGLDAAEGRQRAAAAEAAALRAKVPAAVLAAGIRPGEPFSHDDGRTVSVLGGDKSYTRRTVRKV